MAEANIVPIRAGLAPEPPAGEVDAETVQDLERLLAAARAGEVIGVAYATVHPGRLTSFHRVGFGGRSLLGALVLLQARICKDELEA